MLRRELALTGGVWLVLHIVLLLALSLCCLPLPLELLVDFFLRCSWPGLSFAPFLWTLHLKALLLLLGIVCGPTCMSLSHHTSSHDEEDEVNLSTQFQGLFISVRGSASSSVDFVQRIAAVSDSSSLSASPIRPASSASLPRSLESVRETRSDIEASFPACPVSWLRAAGRLQATSTKFSGEQRIQRAWKAGNWARAVLREKVGSPNRTPAIELPNRQYVVLRGPGIVAPAFFDSSRELFRAVGHLEGSDTICHGFPTKLEAEVYVAGSEALLADETN